MIPIERLLASSKEYFGAAKQSAVFIDRQPKASDRYDPPRGEDMRHIVGSIEGEFRRYKKLARNMGRALPI